MWERLVDSGADYFVDGVAFKFKTIDTAGNFYHYALGFRMDHDEDLSFVGLDGRTWGYGRCTLPVEARFEGRKYTLSKTWIQVNFIAIVRPVDLNDVWVCVSMLHLALEARL